MLNGELDSQLLGGGRLGGEDGGAELVGPNDQFDERHLGGRRWFRRRRLGHDRRGRGLRDEPPDFLVLFSSITAVAGGVGQVDYCAANA
ncbi:MAG: KR domain-containing protein, partial [Anaerolineales bacterium]